MAQPGSKLALKLALVALAVVAAFGAAEVAMRVRLSSAGTPWSAAGARERIERMRAEVGGGVGWEAPEIGDDDRDELHRYANLVLHPYYGYDSSSVEQMRERIVERLGAERSDSMLVLVVGGSVAALFCGRTDGGADELERLIAADPRAGGRDVEVFGLARQGFKQPQQLHLVADFLRQGVRPDVVLNLDGYNELQMSIANLSHGVPVDWPSFAHWTRVSNAPPPGQIGLLVNAEASRRAFDAEAERVAASPLLRSALFGRGGFARLEEMRARVQADVDAAAAARDEAEAKPVDIPAALPGLVDVWTRSSRTLAGLCESAGVRYVHALQPTLHDRGAKVVTAEEERDGIRGAWSPGIELGYPLLREAGAKLAAEDVRFCDASDAFVGVDETLYYDPCHFKRAGNVLLARRLTPAVLDALE